MKRVQSTLPSPSPTHSLTTIVKCYSFTVPTPYDKFSMYTATEYVDARSARQPAAIHHEIEQQRKIINLIAEISLLQSLSIKEYFIVVHILS